MDVAGSDDADCALVLLESQAVSPASAPKMINERIKRFLPLA